MNRQAEQKLWEAAASGDNATIRMLAMEEGVDINARNEDGFTAFNLATMNGHADTATTILAVREMYYLRQIGYAPGAEQAAGPGQQKTGTLD